MNDMIQIHHDGQQVMATRNMHWIAQSVYKGSIGIIHWKWIWCTLNYKHWSTHTKKNRMNTTCGFWAPVVIWKNKRNKPGYNCISYNLEGFTFI